MLSVKKPKPKRRDEYEVPEYLPKIEFRGSIKEAYPNIEELYYKPRLIIKPTAKLEHIIEMYETELRDKEKAFENLSEDEKIIYRLKEIKANIADREKTSEKLEKMLVKIKELMKNFAEYNKEYYETRREPDINDYLNRKSYTLHTGSKFSVSRLLKPDY